MATARAEARRAADKKPTSRAPAEQARTRRPTKARAAPTNQVRARPWTKLPLTNPAPKRPGNREPSRARARRKHPAAATSRNRPANNRPAAAERPVSHRHRIPRARANRAQSDQPGGGKPDASPGQDRPFSPTDDAAEKANLEYARKATDLALAHLKNELAKDRPDPELLNRLGWTRGDLEKFVKRWEQLRGPAQAGGNRRRVGQARTGRGVAESGLAAPRHEYAGKCPAGRQVAGLQGISPHQPAAGIRRAVQSLHPRHRQRRKISRRTAAAAAPAGYDGTSGAADSRAAMFFHSCCQPVACSNAFRATWCRSIPSGCRTSSPTC